MQELGFGHWPLVPVDLPLPGPLDGPLRSVRALVSPEFALQGHVLGPVGWSVAPRDAMLLARFGCLFLSRRAPCSSEAATTVALALGLQSCRGCIDADAADSDHDEADVPLGGERGGTAVVVAAGMERRRAARLEGLQGLSIASTRLWRPAAERIHLRRTVLRWFGAQPTAEPEGAAPEAATAEEAALLRSLPMFATLADGGGDSGAGHAGDVAAAGACGEGAAAADGGLVAVAPRCPAAPTAKLACPGDRPGQQYEEGRCLWDRLLQPVMGGALLSMRPGAETALLRLAAVPRPPLLSFLNNVVAPRLDRPLCHALPPAALLELVRAAGRCKAWKAGGKRLMERLVGGDACVAWRLVCLRACVFVCARVWRAGRTRVGERKAFVVASLSSHSRCLSLAVVVGLLRTRRASSEAVWHLHVHAQACV